jgi:hypothetical protein
MVLAHWNKQQPVSRHITRTRYSEPTNLCSNSACLEEKHYIHILFSLFWPDPGWNSWFIALKAIRQPLHYPPSRVDCMECLYDTTLLNYIYAINDTSDNKGSSWQLLKGTRVCDKWYSFSDSVRILIQQ